MAEFFRYYQDIAHKWQDESNYIVLLATKSKESLDLLYSVLTNNNVKNKPFHEPDLNNAITAIAVEPTEQASKLLSQLPLAMKEGLLV